MSALIRSYPTLVWLALSVLTVVSWMLGADHPFGRNDHTIATMAIIAVTVFKARLVGLYFMELRDAPTWLRVLFESFCVALLIMLTTMYLYG
jgi:caa(3)-type oxidase subunit IV